MFRNANLLAKPPKNVAHIIGSLTLKAALNLKVPESEDTKVKARKIIESLTLLQALHSAAKKLDLDEDAVWKETVAKTLTEFRYNIPCGRNFRDVKSVYNKLAAPLGLDVIRGSEKKAAKRPEKIPAEPKDEPVKAKKKTKKKKKHNKEGLEAKKKEKKFAVEGQFEGLEMPSFANVVMNDNANFETRKSINGKKRPSDDEVEKPKKKKSKKGKSK